MSEDVTPAEWRRMREERARELAYQRKLEALEPYRLYGEYLAALESRDPKRAHAINEQIKRLRRDTT